MAKGAFRWPTYSHYMTYRLLFDAPDIVKDGHTLLHFGAVDYNASVYLNGAQIISLLRCSNKLSTHDFLFLSLTLLTPSSLVLH